MNDFCIDGQATLDEILIHFRGYHIYGLDGNADIVVVESNGNVLITFELIDCENDGTPDVYQVYDTNYDDVKFSEVAHLWADAVTKLA